MADFTSTSKIIILIICRYLHLLVSENNPSIRRVALEKAVYGSRRDSAPHYDVEYSLSKLLDRELDLVRNIQLVVSDLSFRYDYTINNLFDTLDNYNLGYLTAEKYEYKFKNLLVSVNFYKEIILTQQTQTVIQ